MFSNLFADDPGLYAFALTMQQFINVVTFLVGFRYFVPQSQPEFQDVPSAARVAAGAFGFLTLIRVFDGPDR